MRLAPAGFRSHAALASTVSGSAEVGKAVRRLFISTRTKMPRGWSNLGCRAAADPQGFDAGQYRKTEITGSSVCCTRLSVPPHPLGCRSTHRRTRQFRGQRASAPTMIEEASSQRTRRWRELDSNLRFRARAVSVLPLRDQMLASSSSSGEPGESPFSRPGHFREAADNYDCAGRGQPAPHTPSPGRRMAISRRGSYAKTTPRTSTSPTPITRPRRGEGAAAT
jgi:hypothetical protein